LYGTRLWCLCSCCCPRRHRLRGSSPSSSTTLFVAHFVCYDIVSAIADPPFTSYIFHLRFPLFHSSSHPFKPSILHSPNSHNTNYKSSAISPHLHLSLSTTPHLHLPHRQPISPPSQGKHNHRTSKTKNRTSSPHRHRRNLDFTPGIRIYSGSSRDGRRAISV
jgi:hypothetical protein